MFITARSRKSIGEVRQKFEDASAARKFGVLGIHNVTATLQGKGLVFDRKLYIYEICNPVPMFNEPSLDGIAQEVETAVTEIMEEAAK